MTIFQTVNDDLLARLIGGARERLILVAPGLYMPVAKAIAARFRELGQLSVTLVLDASEDVCRIGFGEIEALKQVHSLSGQAGFYVRNQPGLRVGILVADQQTLVWSPTPRSVEAEPSRPDRATGGQVPAPNGLFLGGEAAGLIANAVAADGSDVTLDAAEIGTSAVTPAAVDEVSAALAANPPVPVDLQRATRVFSTRLEYIELEMRGASMSRQRLKVASDLLNPDAPAELRDLLETSLKPFADLRDWEVEVPTFVDDEAAYNRAGNPIKKPVTEEGLKQEREAIEARFMYYVSGYGWLIEKDRKAELLKRLEILQLRVVAHGEGLRKKIEREAKQRIATVESLIRERARRAGLSDTAIEALVQKLPAQLAVGQQRAPEVRWLFKGISWEQTSDKAFLDGLEEVLPRRVKQRLGPWYEEFSALRERERRAAGQGF